MIQRKGHQGAELDLLVMHRGQRLGFEMKFSDAPGVTKSMRVAHADLGLAKLFVVYPGPQSYALEANTEVLCIFDLQSRLAALR